MALHHVWPHPHKAICPLKIYALTLLTHTLTPSPSPLYGQPLSSRDVLESATDHFSVYMVFSIGVFQIHLLDRRA